MMTIKVAVEATIVEKRLHIMELGGDVILAPFYVVGVLINK